MHVLVEAVLAHVDKAKGQMEVIQFAQIVQPDVTIVKIQQNVNIV